MNVLFVGGGRRVTLAQMFKERGCDVYSYETKEEVPISCVAKVIEGKRWNDPRILDDIPKVISKYKIDLVVPLMDEASIVCSKIKNPIIATSSRDINVLCFNKRIFEAYMLINHPKLYPKDDGTFPKFLKPPYGFGSKGIMKIYNKETEVMFSKLYKNITQRFIDGKEYSVDAYFDKKGNYVDSITRYRKRVFDGEVISCEVIDKPKLELLVRTIGEEIKLKGPTCWQFIEEKDTNAVYIIEINARFGGGATLSIECGLDMIKYLQIEYGGMPGKIEPGLHYKYKMERFLTDCYFRI